MKKYLYAILPPVLLALILSCIYILPREQELKDSAITPNLPLSYDLEGWFGERQQESEIERNTLPSDTKFSKASYNNLNKKLTPVNVSLVYSGNDMNASIHRPERCLPSQGHINILTSHKRFTLNNGVSLSFTRLVSTTPHPQYEGSYLHHVNYYLFVGHAAIASTHLRRTLRDMYDRVVNGYVQRWAYFHSSTYWCKEFGITEEEAEANMQQLVQDLLPHIIDWKAIGY